MKTLLTSAGVLAVPALALYVMFEIFNIGNEGSRLVVSIAFGLVLSIYILARFPRDKRGKKQGYGEKHRLK